MVIKIKIKIIISIIVLIFYNDLHSQNTIHWMDDTIYINSDFIIDYDTHLIIGPGVTVVFDGYYKLLIRGIVSAEGNESDSIIFIVSDTSGFFDFNNNNGAWGGLHFLNRTDNDTSFFNFCVFKFSKACNNNYDYDSTNYGGVIYSKNYSNILFNNCTFINNKAKKKGGGIYIEESQSLTINNSNFINNYVCFKGGAVFVKNTSLLLQNNLFYKNKSFDIDSVFINDTSYIFSYYGMGSALYVTYCEDTSFIINNRFFNNSAYSSTIFLGNNNYLLQNNIICNNNGLAFYDGYGLYSNGKIENNTVVNNYDSLQTKGGIFTLVYYGNYSIKNNIIWFNFNGFPDPFQINSDLSIYYNCIFEGYGHPSMNNIDDPPEFTNPTPWPSATYDALSADWTLLETSPCINAGTPDTTGLNLPLTDIAGNPRVYGNRIDMGAYENQTVWVYVNNNAPVAENIKVYPNPGNDKIFINLPPETENATFVIVNGMGNVLIHTQINNRVSTIYPYKLPQGIYYYRIYSKNKILKSGKWVKTTK